jgi:hypothetical protein
MQMQANCNTEIVAPLDKQPLNFSLVIPTRCVSDGSPETLVKRDSVIPQ